MHHHSVGIPHTKSNNMHAVRFNGAFREICQILPRSLAPCRENLADGDIATLTCMILAPQSVLYRAAY
jgi:hypothetical protein